MANQQINEHFREDLLSMLLHLRLAEMYISILKENTCKTEEQKTLVRLSREVKVKMDWFISLATKIVHDPLFIQELEERDDKLQNIGDISSFIAGFKGDLSNEITFLTSSAWRKELLWDAWRHGREEIAESPPTDRTRMRFEQWYERLFPNNIQSPQQLTHDTIR